MIQQQAEGNSHVTKTQLVHVHCQTRTPHSTETFDWNVYCRGRHLLRGVYVNIQNSQHWTKKLFGDKMHVWCWDMFSSSSYLKRPHTFHWMPWMTSCTVLPVRQVAWRAACPSCVRWGGPCVVLICIIDFKLCIVYDAECGCVQEWELARLLARVVILLARVVEYRRVCV